MCCGIVVKHADSLHRACQFDSSMYHNKCAICEVGNWKPHHKIQKNFGVLSLVAAALEIEYATQFCKRLFLLAVIHLCNLFWLHVSKAFASLGVATSMLVACMAGGRI